MMQRIVVLLVCAVGLCASSGAEFETEMCRAKNGSRLSVRISNGSSTVEGRFWNHNKEIPYGETIVTVAADRVRGSFKRPMYQGTLFAKVVLDRVEKTLIITAIPVCDMLRGANKHSIFCDDISKDI